MGKLLSGDFAEGWKQYEWRWQTDGFATTKRDLRQPRWQGHQSLDGKTILLHAEQGLGDTMQFCRYASLVAARRAKVILQVPRALKSLLTGLAGVAHLIADDEAVPLFDFHCPLLSLPLALNTTLATIPVDIPYLFAEHSAVAAWRKRLPATDEMRIGIAWSGNPLHRHDYKRSIALAEFAALFDVRSKFVCLQNEVRTSDAEILDRYPDIAYFGDVLHDFSDTAALIATLDLVITVDTAIAHLAAAMGKRVWILLPFQPDWRWLTLRPDSPWYPSARLFRQSALGDWKSVIVKVRQALQHKEF